MIPPNYYKVLAALEQRLIIKHEQYGTSYQDRDDHWMLQRLWGEYIELKQELEFPIHFRVVEEALDVAIMALLIADNHLKQMEA